MDGGSTFEQLVRVLSPGERESLLQKVKDKLTHDQEPLYVDKDDSVVEVEVEEAYARLPWFYHVVFFVLGFFSAKPPFKLYQDRELAKLGRIINSQAPGFYDHSKSLLLPGFYEELINLKKSSRFFFNALGVSVGQDKGAFFAFLGSLEMEDIHKRLVQETDPVTVAEQNPGVSPMELRRIASRKMEDVIDLIDENQRTAMYANIRSLYCLKQLSSFVFDRMIMAFSTDLSAGGMTCSVLSVRGLLVNLNNILFSLREIPSMSLFEALFVFMLQEKAKKPRFDIEAETQKFLDRAEYSLAAIRKFNRATPLTLIIRCASRDLSLSPALISGGEDWLVVYREYWKQSIKDQFTWYLRAARARELQKSFQSFFTGIDMEPLENMESEANPNGIPVKEALSLSLLRTYHAEVFAKNTAVLNTILINGEFYNRADRLEFSSSYSDLNQLGEVINDFDYQLSSLGEFGLRYAATQEGLTLPALKRRKMLGIVDEVNYAAVQIIEKSKTALTTMLGILNGIIKGDSISKYNTLVNFSTLAGLGSVFSDNISLAAQNIQTVLMLLDEIRFMDTEQHG
ncbi:MAG: DUF5312 domain-containing protein [Treponema sp.]|jgi:hypothetical protein|nr:DUF5312 domain-containing protein [Treponema sp.]